mmetsp:Transcript_50190/g.98220  ORF Transcript_50190/g.98220 Transcript_50190/m.98220 type:complete len:385 (+) Transcript_50190:77-1231(+)
MVERYLGNKLRLGVEDRRYYMFCGLDLLRIFYSKKSTDNIEALVRGRLGLGQIPAGPGQFLVRLGQRLLGHGKVQSLRLEEHPRLRDRAGQGHSGPERCGCLSLETNQVQATEDQKEARHKKNGIGCQGHAYTSRQHRPDRASTSVLHSLCGAGDVAVVRTDRVFVPLRRPTEALLGLCDALQRGAYGTLVRRHPPGRASYGEIVGCDPLGRRPLGRTQGCRRDQHRGDGSADPHEFRRNDSGGCGSGHRGLVKFHPERISKKIPGLLPRPFLVAAVAVAAAAAAVAAVRGLGGPAPVPRSAPVADRMLQRGIRRRDALKGLPRLLLPAEILIRMMTQCQPLVRLAYRIGGGSVGTEFEHETRFVYVHVAGLCWVAAVYDHRKA